jgi:hypothetical protein
MIAKQGLRLWIYALANLGCGVRVLKNADGHWLWRSSSVEVWLWLTVVLSLSLK